MDKKTLVIWICFWMFLGKGGAQEVIGPPPPSWFQVLQLDSSQFVNYMRLHHGVFNRDSIFLQVLASDWAPDSCGLAVAAFLEKVYKVARKKPRLIRFKRVFLDEKGKGRHKKYQGQYGVLKYVDVLFNDAVVTVNILQGYPLRSKESAILDLLEWQNYVEEALPDDYELPEIGLWIQSFKNKDLETFSITIKF